MSLNQKYNIKDMCMSKETAKHVGYVSRSPYDSIRSDLFWNKETGKFYSDVWGFGSKKFTFSDKYVNLINSGKYIWLNLTKQSPADILENEFTFDPEIIILDKL